MPSITKVKFNNRRYSVRLTNHSISRLRERGIEVNNLINTIHKLNFMELAEIEKENKEVALIDYNYDYTMFIAFKEKVINIVTIIEGVDNYIKEGTKIFRI